MKYHALFKIVISVNVQIKLLIMLRNMLLYVWYKCVNVYICYYVFKKKNTVLILEKNNYLFAYIVLRKMNVIIHMYKTCNGFN